MKLELSDAALRAPKEPRLEDNDFFSDKLAAAWHYLWWRIFGRRVPTAGHRVHIGALVLAYRPNTTQEYLSEFETTWITDANRIYVIGDLWVFDYGDTPVQTLTPKVSNTDSNETYETDHDRLLAENERRYPGPP